MKTLILLFVFAFLIVNLLRALFKNRASGKQDSSSLRQGWMFAAGHAGLEFVRPSAGSGPVLRGKKEDVLLQVSLSEEPFAGTCFHAEFPRSRFGELLLEKDFPDPETSGALKRIPLRISGVHAFVPSGQEGRFESDYLTSERLETLDFLAGFFDHIQLTGHSLTLLQEEIVTDGDCLVKILETLRSSALIFSGKTEKDPVVRPEPVRTENVKVPERKPEAKSDVKVPEQPLPPEDLTPDDAAKLLFSAAFPGEAEKKAFESLRGKRVCWSGTLKSVYEFGSDFVFGAGPGAKAAFRVAEVSASFGMKNPVNAVVRLSVEDGKKLRGMTGKDVSFTGTLEKAEFFAREIYLRDGSLS